MGVKNSIQSHYLTMSNNNIFAFLRNSSSSHQTAKSNVQSVKNKTTAALLAFFLGGLGIHQFYLGNGSKGVLYLLFCWTGIPLILALIDLIILLTTSEEVFNRKYNSVYQPQSTQNITINTPALNSHGISVADELDKLSDLKTRGIITEDEFTFQKKKILS